MTKEQRHGSARGAGEAVTVIRASQTPKQMAGNGSATAVLLVRERAKGLAADRDLAAAEETPITVEIKSDSRRAPHVERPRRGVADRISITDASCGIRADAILPGLLDTPMAIVNRVGEVAHSFPVSRPSPTAAQCPTAAERGAGTWTSAGLTVGGPGLSHGVGDDVSSRAVA